MYYEIVSSVFFLALFGIWSKTGLLNILLKLSLLGLGLWGIVLWT